MADVITVGNRCCLQQLFPNLRQTVDHVVNTVSVYVWNVRQCARIRFFALYMMKDGGGWWGDSWHCELWLNCRRECTERLETVGVKETPSPFFNQSYGPDNGLVFRHSSMHCQGPIIFSLLFLVPRGLFSSHSALGEWRHAASRRQQMKRILYLVKAWNLLK